ncbi:MAG: GGDEF domain-containing protein [Candidatus Cloacimonadaceae bacterium]|jgi:diguanylate cyclase (GGDEF)-like protein|nr:GGDEF domain-containing protein [Candidatus Cloacimonadota bacterium]MDX9950162.1 GGDEF domain-containing protein [Candidatus Syntrophosphaera sp.]
MNSDNENPPAPSEKKPQPSTFGWRRKKHLREMLALLLESDPNQRQYLINMILTLDTQNCGREPTLRGLRVLTATILEQLVPLLRARVGSGRGEMLEFFKYLDHFPLNPEQEMRAALKLVYKEDPSEEQRELFLRLELFWLLTIMGDLDSARHLRKELENQVSLQRPRLYATYMISVARILQHRERHLSFSSLWMNLVCEMYRLDGPETALYMILRWIRMLNWGRDTALRKMVLHKFGAKLRDRRDLLSATLLHELFMQENRDASPAEKMQYVMQLRRHPSSLLSAQQLQYLHFFAGNYLSAVKASFRQSIREFKHSNYYLHKSWAWLSNLSDFLGKNLDVNQYSRAMSFLQQNAVDLGRQISLQNNAYVETLHENYETIKSLLKQVEELSITDKLTGLKNRRYMASGLDHAFQLAIRQRVPVCLAILDIDHFKRVNEQFGHLAGDYVLKRLSRLLLGFFRKSDIVIRWGGEEFLIILFDVNEERMAVKMENLSRKIRESVFKWKDTPISVTVSIGWTSVKLADLHQDSLEPYFQRVDDALFEAKDAGRDLVLRAKDTEPDS